MKSAYSVSMGGTCIGLNIKTIPETGSMDFNLGYDNYFLFATPTAVQCEEGAVCHDLEPVSMVGEVGVGAGGNMKAGVSQMNALGEAAEIIAGEVYEADNQTKD